MYNYFGLILLLLTVCSANISRYSFKQTSPRMSSLLLLKHRLSLSVTVALRASEFSRENWNIALRQEWVALNEWLPRWRSSLVHFLRNFSTSAALPSLMWPRRKLISLVFSVANAWLLPDSSLSSRVWCLDEVSTLKSEYLEISFLGLVKLWKFEVSFFGIWRGLDVTF